MPDHSDSAMRAVAPEGRMPLRSLARDASVILGFALVLSYSSMSGLVNGRTVVTGDEFSTLFTSLERLVQAAVYLVLALVATRAQGLASRRVLVCSASALAVVGMLASLPILAVGPSDVTVLCVHGLRLVGNAGFAVLWLAWAELYARMDARHVLAYYLAANVSAALVTLALSMAPFGAVVIALTACLPVASTLLLVRAGVRVREAPYARGEAILDAYAFPAVPIVLMAVFTFTNVFARDVLTTEDRVYATMGTLVCLVFLLVAVVPRKRTFGLWGLYATAFPVTLAGLFGLLLMSEPWGVVAMLMTHAGEALFGVFIVVTLCNVSYRFGVSALVLFGFSQCAGALAGLAAAELAFSGLLVKGTDGFTLAVGVTALALSVCFVALMRGVGEATWGVPARDGKGGSTKADATGEPGTGPVGVVDDRGSLREACARVAYACGLTRREEEVLALLAQDKGAAAIEEELCVTMSTAKSHAHAVYQKTGWRSRREVVERMTEMVGG